MKRNKILYWIATVIVALVMVFSGTLYLLNQPEMIKNFEALGLPLYLMPFLGIAKILGGIALAIPPLEKIKEWAYAGFAFTFLGATWIHIATQTPFIAPVIFLGILSASYFFRLKIQSTPSHS